MTALQYAALSTRQPSSAPNCGSIRASKTDAGSYALEIIDETTNTSDEPGELQLLYHTNFGAPLLEAGAQIVAAVSEVTPYDEHSAASIERWRYCEGPTPGFVEQCYFLRPIADDQGAASIMLRNAQGDRAVCLSFDVQEFLVSRSGSSRSA